MINDSRSVSSEQRSEVSERWTGVSEQWAVNRGHPILAWGFLRSAVGAICKSPYAGVCDRGQWTVSSEQRLPHISMRVLRSAVGAICKSPYAGACDRDQWTVNSEQWAEVSEQKIKNWTLKINH